MLFCFIMIMITINHNITFPEFMIEYINVTFTPLTSVFGCWEYNNRYNVLDQNGTILLSAKEQSECYYRAFCNNIRPFSMPLINPQVSIIDINVPLCAQ